MASLGTLAVGQDRGSSRRGRFGQVLRHWPEYLCVAPFFVLFAVFAAYPIVWSFVLSFQRWDGINTARWVGLDNYRFMLGDPLTRQLLGNTLAFLVLLVPLGLFLPLVFGVILNGQTLRFRGVFRTIIFVPVVTSLVSVGIVFKFIFGAANGWLNHLLAYAGLGPYPWLTAEGWARVPLVTLTIWGGVGFSTLIVLGGLQSIDGEIYDAAKVDGAGAWRTFWQITLPLMRPVMIFLLITSTIAVMTMFGQPYVLTGGGPSRNTLTPVLHIYNLGFGGAGGGGRIGDAAAFSFLLTALMLVITFVQFRLTRARDV